MIVRPAEKAYYEELGKAIRTVRENQGKTQCDLVGVKEQTVRHIENGHTNYFGAKALHNIIRALGFETEEALLAQAKLIKSWAEVTSASTEAYAEKLGDAIRVVRLNQNKTQHELPVSAHTASCIEHGKFNSYSRKALQKVISSLGFDSEAALLNFADTLNHTEKRKISRAPIITPEDEAHAKELGIAIRDVRRIQQKKPADIGDKTIVKHIEAGRVARYTPEQLLQVIQSLGYANEAGILAKAKEIQQRFERIMAELRQGSLAQPEDLKGTRDSSKGAERGK